MNKIAGKVIGNTTATPMPIPDWNQTDEKKADFIKNKPDIDGKFNKVKNDITELQKSLNGKADGFTVENIQKEVENISEDVNKNKSNIDAMSNELSKTSSALPFKADKASFEAVRDKVEGIEKDVSVLDNSLKTVSNALLSHDSNENIHVTPDEKTKWNDADNKFALIENGIIEVKETVVGNLNNILVYDKNGNVATDIENIHTGTFRLFVKYEDENPDVIFIQPDGYLLMEQRVMTFDGIGGNEIVQTILMNDQLYTRVTGDLNFLVGEFGEFAAIDLTPVDTLESDDANAPLSANMGKKLNEKKEDSSNKSDVIDDSADDTKYPTSKAVKDFVSSVHYKPFKNIIFSNGYWNADSNKMQLGVSYNVINIGYIPIDAIYTISIPSDLYRVKYYGYDDRLNFVESPSWLEMSTVTQSKLKQLLPNSTTFKMSIQNAGGAYGAISAEEVAKKSIIIGNEIPTDTNNILYATDFNKKFQNIAYSQLINKTDTSIATVINTKEHYEYVAKHDGFSMIKGDIRLTSDGYLVMCHDKGVTFDANGKVTTFDENNCTLFYDMTYEQVMSLTHAKQFQGADVGFTDIDTFLHICKKYGKFAYVTMREEYIEDVASILVEKIKKYGLEHCCIVNNYSWDGLREIRKLSKYIAVSHVQSDNKVLTKNMVNMVKDIEPAVVTIVNSSMSNCDNAEQLEAMEYAKQIGVKIFNAILNSTENIDKCVDYGFAACQSYIPYE